MIKISLRLREQNSGGHPGLEWRRLFHKERDLKQAQLKEVTTKGRTTWRWKVKRPDSLYWKQGWKWNVFFLNVVPH